MSNICWFVIDKDTSIIMRLKGKAKCLNTNDNFDDRITESRQQSSNDFCICGRI